MLMRTSRSPDSVLVLVAAQLPLLLFNPTAASLFGSPTWQSVVRVLSSFTLGLQGLLLVTTVIVVRQAWTRNFDVYRQALQKAEDLTECSSDLIWEVDASGTFTFVSDHSHFFSQVVGLRLGSRVVDLMTSDPVTPRHVWEKQIEDNRNGLPFRDFRYYIPLKKGGTACISVNGVPMRSGDGRILGYRGTSRDLTAEVETLAALERQARQDTLTGLPNRRLLEERLRELERLNNDDAAVFLLDLDGFKAVNDRFGHAAGDLLLQQVADRLLKVVGNPKQYDFGDALAARLGGDEFAIVLQRVTPSAAKSIANSISSQIRVPYAIGGATVAFIGVSIGGVLVPQCASKLDDMLKCADKALYVSKRQKGRNVTFFETIEQVSVDESLETSKAA